MRDHQISYDLLDPLKEQQESSGITENCQIAVCTLDPRLMTISPLYPCGKLCSRGTHNKTVKNPPLSHAFDHDSIDRVNTGSKENLALNAGFQFGCQRKHLQMGRSVFLFAELNFGIASQLRPNRHPLSIFLNIVFDGLAVLFLGTFLLVLQVGFFG